MLELAALAPSLTTDHREASLPGMRSGTTPAAPSLLALVLDEVDYGVIVVNDDDAVVLANHAARSELADGPLVLLHGRLCGRRPADDGALRDALVAARQRGLRRLVTLGREAAARAIAVLPLCGRAALVLTGKARLCQQLSVQSFARLHALTPAETRVLELLAGGEDPRGIARIQGVGLATVRTQIASIRAKTATDSIRDLVRRVAGLPPMVSALRTGAAFVAGATGGAPPELHAA